MKLKEFIQKLQEIAKEHGDSAKIVMADNISAVDPVFLRKYPNKNNVVITDKESKRKI
jgi:hypothetical protein